VKLVHLVGFIVKKFVTMHGHKNSKKTHTHTHRIQFVLDDISHYIDCCN